MKKIICSLISLIIMVSISHAGSNRCSFKNIDKLSNDKFSVSININNKDTLAGFQVPFSFENEYFDLTCDSVSFVDGRCGRFDMLQSEIDNESKTIFIMGVFQTNPSVDNVPLLPGFGAIAEVYFSITDKNENAKARNLNKVRFFKKRFNKTRREITFSFWTIDGEYVESVFENNAFTLKYEE